MNNSQWARPIGLQVALLSLAALLILPGCATKIPQVDKSFLEPLLVFPFNDARENRRLAIDGLGGDMNKTRRPVGDAWMAKHKLALVRYAADYGLVQNVTIEDLQKVRRERLKLIAQNDERFALFLYLTDLSSTGGGAYVKCSLAGYLVDISTGEVIWKNEVSNRDWRGIIGGPLESIFASAVNSPEAKEFNRTLVQLFDTFPILEKTASTGAAPSKSQ